MQLVQIFMVALQGRWINHGDLILPLLTERDAVSGEGLPVLGLTVSEILPA